MLCIGIFSTIGMLGLISLKTWCRRHYPDEQKAETLKREASEHLALQQFELAQRKLAPLVLNCSFDAETAALYLHALRGQRQFLQALDFAKPLLTNFSEDLNLRKELGRIYLDLKQNDRALEYLQSSQAVLHQEQDVLDLATAYFRSGQLQKCWGLLSPFLSLSCNGRLHALAGDCLFHWKRFDEAILHFEKARFFSWSNLALLSKLAHSLKKEQREQEAERYFREILEKDSSNLPATLGLGECYQQKGAYDRALLIYQRGKAWDTADPRLLAEAGICAAHTRQFPHAQLYLSEALKRGPHKGKILAYLAYSLEAQQNWEEAEVVYQQLVKTLPEHASGYLGLAWLFGMGLSSELSNQKGLEMAHQALQLCPEPSTWEILSACEARAGNFDRAHDIQEKLTSRSQDARTRVRRENAMAALRNRQPLNQAHVGRARVA